MKRNFTKLVSGILAGAMIVSMAACGGQPTENAAEQPTEKAAGEAAETSEGQEAEMSTGQAEEKTGGKEDISVGIVVKTATNAHFQDIAYGAMLAGKELGITVKVDNTTTEVDVEGQITKCENLITSGVDGLILAANESDGVGAAVEAAYNAGIPFVAIDTVITNQWGDQEKEYLPTYISAEHTELAYHLASQVFDELGGKGNVVVLRGVDAASSSQERTAGIEKAIEEYPDIIEVESQSANYDQDTAATTMSDILQAHPDVDAVLCCNDLMAMGACTALEENGKKVGGEDGVLVAGMDGNIIAMESIAEGKMYATIYDGCILWGYLGVKQAYDMMDGKEVPELTMTTDTIITHENVDDFLPHGREVAEWVMGDEIEEVSDYMLEFVKNEQEKIK
ncbi:MAG: sugar ABC transporter substrate-binding protein [Eubacterium sp.]|nr:sugar ABC transporter substrate-binding protein [Eubacterium sp.]